MRNALGKFVDNTMVMCGKGNGLCRFFGCCVFSGVDNQGVFTQLFTQVLRVFFHRVFNTLLPVIEEILPTINKAYKDNNELNKPILLLGGCV